MDTAVKLTREIFMECDWSYDVSPENHYGYSSVMSCLQKSAKAMEEAGKPEHAKVLARTFHKHPEYAFNSFHQAPILPDDESHY